MEEPDVLQALLWTESHRPKKLADLALDDDNRAVLSKYLKAGEIPHLLLTGPPGIGKTTIARIIYRGLDCRHLVLNASSERGIDTVREKVGSFVQAMMGGRWNIVFLDEADAMTADAQTALRNLIEAHADRARFILTANKLFRVIGPIQSRCQVIQLAAPPLKERFRILASVLKAEGITAETPVILSYAERYPDLRRMLFAAQRAFLAKGHLPSAAPETATDGVATLELLLGRNWTGLRRITTADGFDPQQVLRELFWAVADDHPKCGFIRHVVGKAVHESGFTPDPVILFLGCCAEVMEGL